VKFFGIHNGMRVLILLLSFIPIFVITGDSTLQVQNARPRLILVISVDQMRFDYLTRFKPVYEGGFKWLHDHGAIFSKAMFRHSSNETGPGHAVLLTGRHGSHSGIVANGWYDSFLKDFVNVVDDPIHVALAGKSRGATPANLIGFTVGDALKKEVPATKVVAVALKDRSAVLMGGKKADAAYWYDPKTGLFVSSTYYMNELPSWLEKINAEKFPDEFAKRKWERLKTDEAIYMKYAGPDAVEGEWDRVHTTFPHVILDKPQTPEFYDGFRRLPFADELTLRVAIEAFKAHDLGTDATTDILAVGFSATDIIGHTFGPDSQELMDQMLRLDQTIQKLFQEIIKRSGLNNTIVIFSADHGVMPLAEILQSKGIPAKRVLPSVLEDVVVKSLGTKYPDAHSLIIFDQPHFYLNESELKKRGLERKDVEDVVVKAIRESGLAEKVYTQSELLSDPPPNDLLFPLFKNSFFASRSPHILVALKQYIYMEDYPGGTGHGGPYEYDRHVPVVLAGPGIIPGVYDQESGPEDIAPTLAELLKLKFPKEDDARVLAEALKK
jgi:predicted AlkP superfamily pyrophosphatase or phosphodiesterase